MAGAMDTLTRKMTVEDYEQACKLWTDIKGFGIRSIDGPREGMGHFFRRNPTTNMVAVQNGLIIGNTLCGHDGGTGCFHHVCVAPRYRKHGIGYRVVRTVMETLQCEGANKISLIAFKNGEVRNAFWQGIGQTKRRDINSYEFILNREDTTRLVC